MVELYSPSEFRQQPRKKPNWLSVLTKIASQFCQEFHECRAVAAAFLAAARA
jgi:hypothetical protein